MEINTAPKTSSVSGGENISTIEVEGVYYRRPAVLEAAVVARPDAGTGRNALRLSALKAGQGHITEEDIQELLPRAFGHI